MDNEAIAAPGVPTEAVGGPPAAGTAAALRLLGPAYVAAIAYVDPGNFATNFAAGTAEGYSLIWVVVLASAMAALIQYLAARLGAASGKDLCQVCRERLPRPVVLALWAQAELACMATDLAEVVGGAVALQLLCGVSLLAGGILVGGVSFVILAMARHQARLERFMAAVLAVIFGAFAAGSILTNVRLGGLAQGLVPRPPEAGAALLAAGIVGATVMPHAIYVHSALARRLYWHQEVRGAAVRRALRRDVASAMTLASLSGVAMLAVAGAALAGRTGSTGGTVTLQTAYRILGAGGSAMAVLFAAALLVAGLGSASVGTYAGQVVMSGFLRISVPLPVRRLVTLVPAVAVLGAGLEPTRALIGSQVALSFVIPFALIPLVLFTRRADVMGSQRVSWRILAAAAACTLAIVALNVVVLAQSM
jgi:manganese transport protein